MITIRIKKRETDKFVVYNFDKTRLDRIAGDIYGDDTFWWLILLANPDYSMEFDIPRNTVFANNLYFCFRVCISSQCSVRGFPCLPPPLIVSCFAGISYFHNHL